MMMESLGNKSGLWGKVELYHSEKRVVNISNDIFDISNDILETYLTNTPAVLEISIIGTESASSTSTTVPGNGNISSSESIVGVPTENIDMELIPTESINGELIPAENIDGELIPAENIDGIVAPPINAAENLIDPALEQAIIYPPPESPPPKKLFANGYLYLVVSPCQLICKVGKSISPKTRLYDRYRQCWLESFKLYIFDINQELEQFRIDKIEQVAFSMLDLYYKHPLRVSVNKYIYILYYKYLLCIYLNQ
jgi:hypothetical protein